MRRTWTARCAAATVLTLGIAAGGSAEEPDDVPVVDVQMRELWRRGHDADTLFFGNLDRVTEDAEGRVLALDTQQCEIRVFDASGEAFGRVGRRGEGPGEFDRSADLFAGLGGAIGVLQTFPGRVVTFTADGDPSSALAALARSGEDAPSYRRAKANLDVLVVSGARSSGAEHQQHFLEVHDATGARLRRLHAESGHFRYGDMEYVEEEFGRFHRRWDLGRTGRVAAATGFAEYRVLVWDADGALAFEIHDPTYRPVERTAREKEEWQRFYDNIVAFNPRSTFELSDVHPAVVAVMVRDDDSVWVVSGGGAYRAPRGVGLVVDVFDASGGFTHRLALHGPVDLSRDELYVVGDRAYVVTEAVDAAVSATGGSARTEESALVEASQLVCYELVGIRGPGD